MESIRFVIITGLSGAGKTVALHTLEDVGYFCIDNLPPALIPRFAELLATPENWIDRVALVLDVRGGTFFDEVLNAIERIEENHSSVKVLYLEASVETLINRFKETRRRHPLHREGNIMEVLEWERQMLEGLRERADFVINTSGGNPSELRRRVLQLLPEDDPVKSLYVSVASFGFKGGVPRDADLVFDVRFLPNPHYSDALRPLTGLDSAVEEFVRAQSVTCEFCRRLLSFLDFLLPHYDGEGKTQLNIALGCTGGRHRSVVLARWLGDELRDRGYPVFVEHRSLSAEEQTMDARDERSSNEEAT